MNNLKEKKFFTQVLHEKLCEKSRRYTLWHEHPFHQHIHWATFLLVLFLVFFGINNVYLKSIHADSTSVDTSSTDTTPIVDSTPVVTPSDTSTPTDTPTPTDTSPVVVPTCVDPQILVDNVCTDPVTPPVIPQIVSQIIPQIISQIIPIDQTPTTIVKVSSPILSGTYSSGVIPFIVKFSKPVNVIGTPELVIYTGGSTTTLNYKVGSGTDRLFFLYYITLKDNSFSIDCSSISNLQLNGGEIKDKAGNDAILNFPQLCGTGPSFFQSNIIIDTILKK